MRWEGFFILLLLILLVSLTPVAAQQGQYGYFEVTSTPQGADVIVDGMFAGETPVIVPVPAASDNGSVIRVMMQGFQIWEQKYPKNPIAGDVVPIRVQLIPVSTIGTLKVSSNPSGALVTINNGKGQMTPWTYRDLPAGNHLVSVFLMGFEPFIRNVEVMPGETVELVANMSIRTGSGTLEVSSDPGGASVYVDGVYSGVTNLVVGHITPGKHEVRITRAGYDDYVEWVSVAHQQTTVVKGSLKPVGSSTGGFIVVTTEPPGASVYLDDRYSGVTETGRALVISNVTPGAHRVYVSSKNYEDYEAVTMVTAGAITPVSIRMNPSPMPQACALILVTSDPAGADITIDRQLKGTTPATIETICSGNHTYSLSLDGYEEYRSSFDLIPGQVLQINTALKPVAQSGGSTSTETPWPSPISILLVLGITGFFLRRRIS